MDFDIEIDVSRSPLSPAENRVALLLHKGLTIKAMAETLHRSVKTVETHLGHIYQKLGVENDKQAITLSWVRGFVRVKKMLVLCLVMTGTANAVLPARVMAEPRNDAPVELPDQRLPRGRQRVPSRSSGRGRRWNRKQEQLWDECFGEF